MVITFVSFIMILSGCFNSNGTIDKIYDVLEGVVSVEKSFESQQEPLMELEKKEQKLYNQIIELGMKNYDQINNLADEALKIVNERQIHMDNETESLKKSKQEFVKMKTLKKDLDDPKVKKLADDLYDIMQKRYAAHDVLYMEYSNGLKYDKELYFMFKKKDVPLETLEAKVNKVNSTYEKILRANEDFNKYTNEYNSKKLALYQKAGFKIKK